MSYLYIAGRGHSGSTIIDAALGQSSQILSVGELVSGLSRYPDEICSCGEAVCECSFWRSVDDSLRDASYESGMAGIAQILFPRAKVTHFPLALKNLILERSDPTVAAADDIIMKKLLLNKLTASILLDSSKEITRCAELLAASRSNRAIFLTRHPVGVCNSYRKRINAGTPLKIFRKKIALPKKFALLSDIFVSLTWTIWLLFMYLIKLCRPKQVIFCRYEDFLTDNSKFIFSLSEFLALDLSDISLVDQEVIDIGHNIGGNEFRHKAEIRFQKNSDPLQYITFATRAVCFLICWPGYLLRRYGWSGKS